MLDVPAGAARPGRGSARGGRRGRRCRPGRCAAACSAKPGMPMPGIAKPTHLTLDRPHHPVRGRRSIAAGGEVAVEEVVEVLVGRRPASSRRSRRGRRAACRCCGGRSGSPAPAARGRRSVSATVGGSGMTPPDTCAIRPRSSAMRVDRPRHHQVAVDRHRVAALLGRPAPRPRAPRAVVAEHRARSCGSSTGRLSSVSRLTSSAMRTASSIVAPPRSASSSLHCSPATRRGLGSYGTCSCGNHSFAWRGGVRAAARPSARGHGAVACQST